MLECIVSTRYAGLYMTHTPFCSRVNAVLRDGDERYYIKDTQRAFEVVGWSAVM